MSGIYNNNNPSIAATSKATGAAAPATSDPNNNSSKATAFTNLLGEVLETCIHEILYNRHLYPRDAFVPTRYLGVRCHGCRIPAVTDYIVDALLVAVPSILSGNVDCISLTLFDANPPRHDDNDNVTLETVLEKYNFEFDPTAILSARASSSSYWNSSTHSVPTTTTTTTTAAASTPSASHPSSTTTGRPPSSSSLSTTTPAAAAASALSISKMTQELEWGLKQLLLRIITLGNCHARSRPLPQTATFKICMRTCQPIHITNDSSQQIQQQQQQQQQQQHPFQPQSCQELEKALMEGTWFEPDRKTCSTMNPTKQKRKRTVWNDDENESKGKNASNETLEEPMTPIIPLKCINAPNIGLKMQFNMEVCDS